MIPRRKKEINQKQDMPPPPPHDLHSSSLHPSSPQFSHPPPPHSNEGLGPYPPSYGETQPQYGPKPPFTPIQKEKREFDTISYGIILLILLSASLFSASLYFASSPDTSLKELLDRNMLNSLDGTVVGYQEGDQITVTDRVSEIEFDGSNTIIHMKSIEGTRYSGWSGLKVTGNLTDRISRGDTIEIVFTVGTSSDGREILVHVEESDITVVKRR